MNKKELGQIGEKISCQYLENIGYQIIEKNFCCRQGEIDIIAKDKGEYVFTEVKTRRNLCYGRPIDAVHDDKQKHIYKSTRYYLHIHKLDNALVRFDVIEVYWKENLCQLKHWKGVDIQFK